MIDELRVVCKAWLVHGRATWHVLLS